MTRQKDGDTSAQEKKLRRRLQKAELAHVRAQQQIEKRQARLAKAEDRLQRRAAALEQARAALVELAALPATVQVRAGATASTAPPEDERPAPVASQDGAGDTA